MELSFTPRGVTRRILRLVTTTGESGRFALCDVPSPGTMALIATRGADSTDRIDGAHIPVWPEGLTGNDIDRWVDPHEIAGIELYVDLVPPQFQPTLSSCGSIVIWTKRRRFLP